MNDHSLVQYLYKVLPEIFDDITSGLPGRLEQFDPQRFIRNISPDC